MTTDSNQNRTLGLVGATSLGVGAIVGGGILALAGVAFQTTGPSAILAFALNGLIALLTVSSFSEMSTAFPESGGPYTFAKKVLTIRAAFAVGWVVWFASIVASVLYALGFAAFGMVVLEQLWQVVSVTPSPLVNERLAITVLALGSIAIYSASLIRRRPGGTQWATIGKVVLFVFLIVGGVWALSRRPSEVVYSNLAPFFANGTIGLFQAMGFTFIALQGYDLIAAVAGEVREPVRVLPRAMLLSLAIALAIYLPLLFIVSTVVVPVGESIVQMSSQYPETVIAVAAENFLGRTGFWLVLIAAALSMLSALYANLFAASSISLAMARDRTLPHFLARVSPRRGTPTSAILLTAFFVILVVLAIPDISSAGAAASLIFLISFALVHVMSILARRRRPPDTGAFTAPLFPILPIVGAVTCASLAIFQAIAVPEAGLIACVWLTLGGALYLFLFARRARVVDAAAEAIDPQLVRTRGKSPLILVPIANPANSAAMVAVANALAPPGTGRVLLLSVVTPPDAWHPGHSPPQLLDAQAAIRESLTMSFSAGLSPEALITVAPVPWSEIGRVSREHKCEGLLLGFSDLSEELMGMDLERLINSVDCDVAVLRARSGWDLAKVRRVLVPVGGRGTHDEQRARLLGSLRRGGDLEIVFLKVLSERVSQAELDRTERELAQIARDKAPGSTHVVVINNSVVDEIIRWASDSDLAILGLQHVSRRHRAFGELSLQVVRDTSCATIMLSQSG